MKNIWIKPGRSRPSPRGTAVIEMVMVIPLLAGIIGLIFFFGWAMMNQQHVRTADRYLAWRTLYGGGPADGLNKAFFRNKAVNIQTRNEPANVETLQDWVDRVGLVNRGSEDLARLMAEGSSTVRALPRDSRVRVQAEFPSDIKLWKRFTGPIISTSGREGREWRWRQTDPQSHALTQIYFEELDQALPKNQAGDMLHKLYYTGW